MSWGGYAGKTPATLVVLTLGIASGLSAQDAPHRERLDLAPASGAAVVEASLTGRATVDYLVPARAGQILSVTLTSDHPANYFNVLPPDSDNEADFVGSTEGSTYRGQVELDGDWKVRVYLIRAAARRADVANYTLSVTVSGEPDPSVARQPNDFGPRAWDARGRVGCARGGAPMRPAACPFKVIRYGEGATVFILHADGGEERILYVQDGTWSTPSGGTVDTRRRGDLWSLMVDDEAYEIPDAVITGG